MSMILLVPRFERSCSGCGQTWKQTHNLNKTRRRNNTPAHEHIIEDDENYTQCRKRRHTQNVWARWRQDGKRQADVQGFRGEKNGAQ